MINLFKYTAYFTKKRLLVSLLSQFIIFFSISVNSQWIQMPAFPVTGYAYDMAFINKDTGYVSMSTPALLRTINGGQSWTVIGNFTIYTLKFPDKLNGYGNGKRGVYWMIYKTTDGGFNWDSVSRTSSFAYEDVEFINKDTGWVSGYDGWDTRFWLTTNGGTTLQQISIVPGGGGAFLNLFFLKQKYNGQYNGWFTKDSKLWRTTNSGYNWNLIYQMQSIPACGYTGWFGDIYFKDTLNGVATRSGGCYLLTTNGGYNWSYTKYNGSSDLSDIGMANSTTGWITVLTRDTIIKTTNFFQSYGKQPTPGGTSKEIFVIDTSTTYIGDTEFSKTTNGGGPIVSVEQISGSIPNEFNILSNYPNPFNSSTTIEFSTPVQLNDLTLSIYDMLGREVKTLVNNEIKEAGRYTLEFNASGFASGVYFYQLTLRLRSGNDMVMSRKMVVVK